MELRDYMHFNRLTCMAMAKQLGIHDRYLSAIKNRVRKPSLELAEKIEILTGGEVSIKELRGKHDT